jgi:hypothetical protein
MVYLKIDNANCITGDFNMDLVKKSRYNDKLVSIFNHIFLEQKIKEPTRVTNSSATLIDFVLTNKFDISNVK